MSRFRSESRFTNPLNPQPRSVPAWKWFRVSSNVVQAHHSQGETGTMNSADSAENLRGLSEVRRGNRFKRSFREDGPEMAEGGANG